MWLEKPSLLIIIIIINDVIIIFEKLFTKGPFFNPLPLKGGAVPWGGAPEPAGAGCARRGAAPASPHGVELSMELPPA